MKKALVIVGVVASSVVIYFAIASALMVRAAAIQVQDANNMKQIALAMLDYGRAHDQFPDRAAICDTDGKPLLSWRVAILPYIGEADLYSQFHLDEPWDSPHNSALVLPMPKVYVSPGERAQAVRGTTSYRVFVGPQTVFQDGRPPRTAVISDGRSKTIMLVESTDAVVWTKPDELVFKPDGPLPSLGGRLSNRYNIAMWDGSVRSVSPMHMRPEVLRALITADGGEVVPPEDF